MWCAQLELDICRAFLLIIFLLLFWRQSQITRNINIIMQIYNSGWLGYQICEVNYVVSCSVGNLNLCIFNLLFSFFLCFLGREERETQNNFPSLQSLLSIYIISSTEWAHTCCSRQVGIMHAKERILVVVYFLLNQIKSTHLNFIAKNFHNQLLL